MIQILNQQIEKGFPGIKGAKVKAIIPITEDLINDILAQSIKGSNLIDQIIIQILPNREMNLTIKKFISFRSKATISRYIQFPNNPIVAIEITGGLIGIFSQFASALNSLFPNYIYFISNSMKIDLSKAMDKTISSKIFSLVKNAEITTASNKIFLNLSMEVG